MQYVFSTEQTKRYRFSTHVNDLVMDRSQAAASEVFIWDSHVQAACQQQGWDYLQIVDRAG